MDSTYKWQKRAGNLVKAELRWRSLTYAHLASRLALAGWRGETEASIKNKLSRGTFSAAFLLACIDALDGYLQTRLDRIGDLD